MNLEATETTLLKPQSVFLNRNFVLLFSGKVISLLRDQIYAFALSWYILDITKSSLTTSIFLVINVWKFTILGSVMGSIGGTAFVFCCIPINVISQKRISDEYRGRFWGFLSSLTSLTTAMDF